MSRSIALDSAAESAPSAPRFRFRKPSWGQIKRAGVSTAKFLWRWLKWPLIVALVVAVIVLLYYIVPPILAGIWFLLKMLIQFVWAVIAIAFTSLWASISHLFGAGDGSLAVSYDAWIFADNDPYTQYTDDFDWGIWTFQGLLVYSIGGVTALLLTYAVTRYVRRTLASRAQAKQDQAAAAARTAESRLKASLDARYAEGRAAGIAEEQKIVRRAFIHAYKPKMALPEVPAGRTRVFWIHAYVMGPDIRPTGDRKVHWADIEGAVPEYAIGAPAYQRIVSNDGDRLAMMTVVFTLKSQATAW